MNVMISYLYTRPWVVCFYQYNIFSTLVKPLRFAYVQIENVNKNGWQQQEG